MTFPPALRTSRTQRRLIIAGLLTVVCLFMVSFVAQTQGPGTNSQLKGKTKEVTPVPDGVVDAGPVVFKKDSDNDGMPDDAEAANGTDPNDPSDADGDNDGDGMSNGDEVARGANPNASDTDGDGVSDLDEVRLGYDPTDPNNTPPSGSSLASLRVSPISVNISMNSLLGYDPVKLRVTGVLADGTTVDLTSGPALTYQSLDSSIAVADDFGTVFANNVGTTTIKVISGSVFADVPVVITAMTPSALSAIDIPGYANNVDVSQDYAYVAAGEAGLVVVNVNDRSAPEIVATFNTPGNANDVRIVGNLAYVADGPSGLQIIDVTTPASPVLRGSLDTPGDSYDVVVHNTLAYVADGSAGIRIVDVSNPSAPALVGAVDTPGTAKGLDASGNFIAVADDSAVVIVDAAIPISPQIVGSVILPGNALDLEVRGRFAYVASFTGGMPVVDFSNPATPHMTAVVDVFYPRDVALGRRYAVAADVLYANAVPIIDLGDPGEPIYSGVVDFYALGDYNGTGIAVTDQYIYMTGSTDPFNLDNGTEGNTRLFIGEYKAPDPLENDTAGIAPTVVIASPITGQSAIEGSRLPISINANDDIQVDQVQLLVNGVVVVQDVAAPYNISYKVPLNVTTITIEARAFDRAGSSATSPPVTINVVPDPSPTVSITFPAEGQQLFEHQQIYLQADASDNGSVESIVFSVAGSPLDSNFYEVPTGVTSLTFGATATDNLGNTASTTRTVTVVPDPPPTITFAYPAEGQSVFEEQDLNLFAEAADNGSIQSVVYSVNGTPLAANYYRVPLGVTALTLGATATDNLGQSTSTTRTVSVIPDPPPTIVFSYPAEGQQLFEEQDIYLAVDVTDNTNIQSIVFSVNGTPLDYDYYRVPIGVTSVTFGATATDDRGHSSSTTRTVSVVPDDPPTVNIVAPAEGAELMEGSVVEFIADATDNLAVTHVEFIVNGEPLSVDWEVPYRQSYTVPTGITSFLLEVAANDNPGHRTVASRTFTVVPDPGTTVTGRVIDTSAQPVANATVTVFGEFTTQTVADGTFSLPNVPTLRGAVLARVTATLNNQPAANASLPKAPIAGGITALGDITLSVLPTAPMFAGATSYVSDGTGRTVVVAGYPDRQSLIYEFSNGQFVPSTTATLPYGAVNSGVISRASSFDSISKIFTQSAGQPGSITDLVLYHGHVQSPVTLTTGLAGENAYMAAGFEGPQRREVLAFLAATGDDPLTLRYRSPNAVSDEFDEEADFQAPLVVPVGSSAPLRSLKLADVNQDGLQDILAIKPVSGSDARLVVIQRHQEEVASFGPSDPSFEPRVESPIIVRSTNAERGVDDFSFARGDGTGTLIYVLGDDRVRIYRNDGTGAFLPAGEIMMAAGQIPTGITVGDLNNDSLTDVLVTTKDASSPESKSLFLYQRTWENNFEPPITRTYTAPVSAGDTRIIIGEWQDSRSLDAAVVDGVQVLYFGDLGPLSSGS